MQAPRRGPVPLTATSGVDGRATTRRLCPLLFDEPVHRVSTRRSTPNIAWPGCSPRPGYFPPLESDADRSVVWFISVVVGPFLI